MGSSNNLATMEPWVFKSTITDSWYPDSFARETESALTKALQQSFFNNQQQPDINPTINHTDYYSSSTITATASGSGSEPETPGSKHRNNNLGVTIAKPNKRKSRASKRSMTTFIQADASNFRQMVQQVTGVKVDGQLPVSMLVKPEPVRQPFINKLQGLLPTLDTSAYLFQYQNKNKNNNTNTNNNNNNNTHRVTVSGSISNGLSEVPMVNHLTEEGGVGSSDFYSFSGFPTLESSY